MRLHCHVGGAGLSCEQDCIMQVLQNLTHLIQWDTWVIEANDTRIRISLIRQSQRKIAEEGATGQMSPHPCDGHPCDHCYICDVVGVCCTTVTPSQRVRLE